MLRVLSDKIREHIFSNIVSYITLAVIFSLGIASGAYIYNCYGKDELHTLYEFFSDAKETFITDGGNNLDIFKSSLLSSVKTVSLIWLSGFTVIGIPFIFFSVFKKGFVFGLITNFLLTNFSDGILTTLILFFADSVMLMPAIYVVSVYSISLSKTLTGMITGKIRYKVNLKSYMLFYFFMLFVILFAAFVYSLAEAYFAGNLLCWFFKLNS